MEGKPVVSSSRKWAFLGVSFSTVSVITCLISFPLIFQYLLALQAGVQEDLDFCRGRSRDLVKEVLVIQRGTGASSERLANAVHLLSFPDPVADARQRRAAKGPVSGSKGENATRLADEALFVEQPELKSTPGQCCTCHKGAIGPQGPNGADGHDGDNGADGEPGTNGAPATINYDLQLLLQKDCPCNALTGDAGAVGPKGPNGSPGGLGAPGEDGKAGENGPAGAAGPQGVPGKGGPKGASGDDGPLIPNRDLPAGPPGIKGPDGPPGALGAAGPAGNKGTDGTPGTPGEPGGPGQDGALGKNGSPGPKGQDGAKGTCNHCAPARLAPGY